MNASTQSSIQTEYINKQKQQQLSIQQNHTTNQIIIIRTILAGIASMISGGTVHPIDTVKIRLQKEGELISCNNKAKKYINMTNGIKTIISNEGIRGLFKGLSMSLGREGTYSALNLGLYEPIREQLGGIDAKNTPVWKKFISGFLSGTIGAIFATPFDLLKVRLQSHEQGKKYVSIEFAEIIRNSGLKGLFRGIIPNLTRGSILTATKMSTYDQSKRIVMSLFNFEDGAIVYFICSFITGFVLSVTTSPMDVIKTRIMSQHYQKTVYKGLIDCACKTYKAEGIYGFYKGFIPQWCRFGPYNIIQLMVWEQLRKLCGLKTV